MSIPLHHLNLEVSLFQSCIDQPKNSINCFYIVLLTVDIVRKTLYRNMDMDVDLSLRSKPEVIMARKNSLKQHKKVT